MKHITRALLCLLLAFINTAALSDTLTKAGVPLPANLLIQRLNTLVVPADGVMVNSSDLHRSEVRLHLPREHFITHPGPPGSTTTAPPEDSSGTPPPNNPINPHQHSHSSPPNPPPEGGDHNDCIAHDHTTSCPHPLCKNGRCRCDECHGAASTTPPAPTLLVLAGGLGTRFGEAGKKQITVIPSVGKSILQLNIEAAHAHGINHVVLVINHLILEIIKNQIVPNLPESIHVDLVVQTLEGLPEGTDQSVLQGRVKPWGTGHAVWSARHAVNGPMVVVNADDLYGEQAFALLSDLMSQNDQWATVLYPLGNTLSGAGRSDNRGVCTVDAEGHLTSVAEYLKIHEESGQLVGQSPNNAAESVTPDTLVSMNFWAFQQNIFPILEQAFQAFLADPNNVESSELFLPSVVMNAITQGQIVNVQTSNDQWLGVTKPEDIERVSRALKKPDDEFQK